MLNTRVVRRLQPCTSLFGHGGLWQGLWEPGHGRLHTSSVPCLSAQELSPRSPFQMDLGPASLSSLLSNELECGVNRVQIWAPPVKTSSFTQHSQLIERVVFRCLGQTFKCSRCYLTLIRYYLVCFSIRLDNWIFRIVYKELRDTQSINVSLWKTVLWTFVHSYASVCQLFSSKCLPKNNTGYVGREGGQINE